MDPKYKSTVRNADQTVHGRLAKSRLASLLDTVKDIGYSEIQRFKDAIGRDGKVVSLHTLMYRLGYNVNCIGIFGPQLDHVGTRVVLQNFTEVRVSLKVIMKTLNDTPSANAIVPLGSAYAVRLIQLAIAHMAELTHHPRGTKNRTSSKQAVQNIVEVSIECHTLHVFQVCTRLTKKRADGIWRAEYKQRLLS